MYAIEFQTKVKDGSIPIPEEYRSKFTGNVRIILLAEESTDSFDMIEHLLANPLIVEGFKRDLHPKIEVHRTANDKPWMRPDMPGIVAVASDVAPPYDLPRAHLDDVDAIAGLVLAHAVPVTDIAWAVRQEA